MLQEKEEIIDAEVGPAENPQVEEERKEELEPQPIGYALTSFILGFFGMVFSISIALCVPGMVIGIVGLAYANKAKEVTRRPFRAFKNIAKPFSIIAIALGAFFTTALMVTGLVFAIIAIVKHVNPA